MRDDARRFVECETQFHLGERATSGLGRAAHSQDVSRRFPMQPVKPKAGHRSYHNPAA